MKEGGPLQRAALLFAWQLQNVLFPVIFHSFVLDRLRREPDRRAASLAEVELENSPCVHTEFRNAYLGPGRDRGIAGVKFGFVQVGSQVWTKWMHEAVRRNHSCPCLRTVVM